MDSLRLLDLTLPSPEENLALDELLLEEMEANGGDPVLRFWESDRHVVVLGRACRVVDDVNVSACQRDAVPVLRRASGGGTVLLGPGCLCYAFVLPFTLHPDLGNIRSTNQFILQRIAQTLQRWQPGIAFEGISDLAIDGFKISGNAQRRTRRALLFHGTILYGMQANVIARYLKHPKRQPAYRGDREHDSFLKTIDALPHQMKHAIAEVWNARIKMEWLPQTDLSRAIATVVERSAYPVEQPSPSSP